MLLILVLLVIYTLSVLGAYLEIHRMHRNEFKMLKPTLSDFLMIFIPFINLMMSLGYLLKIINDKFKLKERIPTEWLARFFRL